MNVTVTMEIPVEKLTDLQALLSSESEALVPVPEVPAVVAAPVEEKKPELVAQVSPAQEVTKSMIRAKGLELTQAGKKAELEAVFKKFGAAKLRDLKEEDYAEAYRLLGEI